MNHHNPNDNQTPQLPPCPLTGEWRYSNGFLMCGTLRIFRADFDTDPSPEFKDKLTSWMVATLNAAAARRSVGEGQARTLALLLKQLAERRKLIDSSAGRCPLCEWGGSDTHRSDCPFMLAAELAASSAPVEGERCVNHCGHEGFMVDGVCLYGETGDLRGCRHVCDFSRPGQQIPSSVSAEEYYEAQASADHEAQVAGMSDEERRRNGLRSRPASAAARRAAEKIDDYYNGRAGFIISMTGKEDVAAILEAELTKE